MAGLELPDSQSIQASLVNWLWRNGRIRPTPAKIERAVLSRDYLSLFRHYKYGNAAIRQAVVQNLVALDTVKTRLLLIHALNDPVRPVVDGAVHALGILGIDDPQSVAAMERIVKRWEQEEQRIRDNWEHLNFADIPGEYVDKSNMRHLKEAKRLLASFRWRIRG